MKFKIWIFGTFLFYFCIVASAFADQRLQSLKDISAAGAPLLALKMLGQAQPQLDKDLYEWIIWEQERYKILSNWQLWNRLLIRIESLPKDLPEPFRQQATSQQARAYIELSQSDQARKLLRQRLWQPESSSSPQYPIWRQQVIDSYLKDGRIDDARIAMLRLDQDFGETDQNTLQIRARLLILAGRYEQAIQLLVNEKSWQNQAIKLLAQFRQLSLGEQELWLLAKRKAIKLQAVETPDAQQLLTYWTLAYFASTKMSEVDRVVALENLLQIDAKPLYDLFAVRADSLWQAYLTYAQLVGNRAELLLGDDINWLALAQKSSLLTPVKARSLFALLMKESSNDDIIQQAAVGYLNTLDMLHASSGYLLNQLFNNSPESIRSVSRIPLLIRYHLVDTALKKADIKQATRLMSGLQTHPEGSSRFDWLLRQSRVMILGGRYEEGDQVIRELISEYTEPNKEQTDKILQILFDLQTVKKHQQANLHFHALLNLPIEPVQRREILFWTADSYKAMKKYNKAALIYMQSAMLPGTESMDPWAQTARFNAAQSLQKSGLIDDARRIYQNLLKVTRDPARRAHLKNSIQQLWLTQRSLQ